MTNFREFNLDSTLSVAMLVAAGLAIAWFALAKDSASQQAQRITAEDRVTVSQDDARFRVTVTAQRPRDFVPASVQADARPTTGSNSQRT
jgi:hypothetical protein